MAAGRYRYRAGRLRLGSGKLRDQRPRWLRWPGQVAVPPAAGTPVGAHGDRLGLARQPPADRVARTMPLADYLTGGRDSLQDRAPGTRLAHGNQNARFRAADLARIPCFCGQFGGQPGNTPRTQVEPGQPAPPAGRIIKRQGQTTPVRTPLKVTQPPRPQVGDQLHGRLARPDPDVGGPIVPADGRKPITFGSKARPSPVWPAQDDVAGSH